MYIQKEDETISSNEFHNDCLKEYMMMSPVVLVFNIAPEKVAKLRFTCMRLGIQVKAVEAADFTQKLGALCGLAEREDLPAPEAPFEDEMLVMAHFTTPLAKNFLASFRQSRMPNVKLKAVITPTNVQWDCIHLHDELMKEREAIAAQGKAVHEE